MTDQPLALPTGRWDEPFVVSASDGIAVCGIGEQDGYLPCPRRSKWMVETVGWDGPGEPPPETPTHFACTLHLAALLTALGAS